MTTNPAEDGDEGGGLDDFLALMSDDEEENDSFVTCRQDTTLTRTFTTNNDTFMSAVSNMDDDELGDEDWIGEGRQQNDDDKTPSPTNVNGDSGRSSRHTLTEEEIQEKLDAAIKQKQEAIQVARRLLGRDDASSAGPSNSSSARKTREVPLDFEGTSPKESEKSGGKRRLVLDSDSEEEGGDNDDDMMERKDLNSSGRAIQKALDKKDRETLMSKALPSDKPSTSRTAHVAATLPPARPSVLTGVTDSKNNMKNQKQSVAAYDPFFGLRVKNPKVSSLAFEAVTEGMKKMRLSTLRPTMDQPENWVTMGVIVERAEPKKSANGHEYTVWRVHDLKNCQDTAVKVLLFGESCKEHWKLQAGATVALVGAQVAEPQQNQPNAARDKSTTLKVAKRAQVMELGYCASFGICKAVRHDGKPCTTFVNLDLSDYCVYHVMNAARKLSSKRGVFSSISGAPPMKRQPPKQPHGLVTVAKPCRLPGQATALNEAGTVRAAGGVAFKSNGGKTVTRTEEKETLGQLMTSRAHLLGAKNLVRATATKSECSGSQEKTHGKHLSMAQFMQERKVAEKKEAEERPPTLGFGISRRTGINLGGPMKSKAAGQEAARLRAIAVINREKDGVQRPKKRPNTDEVAGTPSKKHQLGSITNKLDIESLLKRKSINDKQAEKEEADIAQKYLDGMEKKERVESFVTGCMSMKSVKVVTCKKCAYTAQKQSELCMQSGHAVTRSTAEKRFFKCKACSKRTTAFGLLPNKPCKFCEANDWERVAMKDERKVTLDNEQLKLRGDERPNVNT